MIRASEWQPLAVGFAPAVFGVVIYFQTVSYGVR